MSRPVTSGLASATGAEDNSHPAAQDANIADTKFVEWVEAGFLNDFIGMVEADLEAYRAHRAALFAQEQLWFSKEGQRRRRDALRAGRRNGSSALPL